MGTGALYLPNQKTSLSLECDTKYKAYRYRPVGKIHYDTVQQAATSLLVDMAMQRRGAVRRLDEALRAGVNGALHGADAYSLLRMVLVLLTASRIFKEIRRASMCEGLSSWLISLVVPWLKRIPYVQKQIRKEADKLRASLQPSLIKDLTAPRTTLPTAGEQENVLLELMQERQELDTRYWRDGHVTGAIYHGGREYMSFIGQIYGMFAFTNPLHAAIHPATRQMESEVSRVARRAHVLLLSASSSIRTGDQNL